ncbi:MAG: FAD-dependent oxidoreductase [Thiobacillus sp.]
MEFNKHNRDRRRWLLLAGSSVVAGLMPRIGWTDDDSDSSSSSVIFRLAETGLTGKVVVVGGGMAGATAAKYLRLWGGAGLSVTLVEPAATYTSNIMSNLVLNGSRNIASLGFDYSELTANYGVIVKHATLTSVDTNSKRVLLSDGSTLPYDRLVLAPGVEFEEAYGLTLSDYESRTPHAWRAGAQTELLRAQLVAMPANGTFVLTIPKAPYRCPPGPYERACLVADYLKTYKGAGSRVIVLDENAGIQAGVESFTQALNVIHAGVLAYHPGVSSIAIDASSKTISYVDKNGAPQALAAHVINPIAPHRAAGSAPGGWLAAAGLANGVGGRWAQVNVLSYESTAIPGVHVIGDASQCGMPKAGHVANQEAKICADAITRMLAGGQPDPQPVANSACYSPITATTASWLTAVYQYDPATTGMKIAANGGSIVNASATEAASINSRNFNQMNVWFNTLMSDSFA